jgi:hypothetical protein
MLRQFHCAIQQNRACTYSRIYGLVNVFGISSIIMLFIEHCIIFPEPHLVITIAVTILVALYTFVVVVVTAALVTLCWDNDAAVLEARVPFELVELNRIKIIECVFP